MRTSRLPVVGSAFRKPEHESEGFPGVGHAVGVRAGLQGFLPLLLALLFRDTGSGGPRHPAGMVFSDRGYGPADVRSQQNEQSEGLHEAAPKTLRRKNYGQRHRQEASAHAGTGTLANGAVSIASWTPGSEVLTPMVGRTGWVHMTSGAHAGQTFIPKVTSAGASLGIRDPSPFAA
jgi:hypothetical protein